MKQKGNKPPDNKRSLKQIQQDRLERLLRASARDRARMVIDHRESRNYNLSVTLAEDEFTAIEESLLRSDREEQIYKKARLLQTESKEVVLLTMYHSSQVLNNLEKLRAIKRNTEDIESLEWVTQQLGHIKNLATEQEQKAIAKEVNTLQLRIIARIENAHEREIIRLQKERIAVIKELAENLSDFRALLISGRRILKEIRMPIKPHLLHYKSMEQYIDYELKGIYKQGIATPKEVEAIDPETTAKQIIESRLRYIGN